MQVTPIALLLIVLWIACMAFAYRKHVIAKKKTIEAIRLEALSDEMRDVMMISCMEATQLADSMTATMGRTREVLADDAKIALALAKEKASIIAARLQKAADEAKLVANLLKNVPDIDKH